jgi:GT2 family glycosyltransferase
LKDIDKRIMMGMVTFGNLPFTKLAIESMKNTASYPLKYFVVVGKPGDIETQDYLTSEGIEFIVHDKNYGFPKSINDIYDRCWKGDDQYDYLIMAGNDIICYPYCIDSLVDVAQTTDYDVINGFQFHTKNLIAEHPEAARYFHGPSLNITDFSSKCWELFDRYSTAMTIEDGIINNVQNLCLYKRSLFGVVGYTDVNFYPAYYVDIDYTIRIIKSGVLKYCMVRTAAFFHFWSRTLFQGSGGSNDKFFKRNQQYYIGKWGGDWNSETKIAPILINDRLLEDQMIERWRNL